MKNIVLSTILLLSVAIALHYGVSLAYETSPSVEPAYPINCAEDSKNQSCIDSRCDKILAGPSECVDGTPVTEIDTESKATWNWQTIRAATCNLPYELSTWGVARNLPIATDWYVRSTTSSGTYNSSNAHCQFRPPDYSTIKRLQIHGYDSGKGAVTTCLYRCTYYAKNCSQIACVYSNSTSNHWSSVELSEPVYNNSYSYFTSSQISLNRGEGLQLWTVEIAYDTGSKSSSDSSDLSIREVEGEGVLSATNYITIRAGTCNTPFTDSYHEGRSMRVRGHAWVTGVDPDYGWANRSVWCQIDLPDGVTPDVFTVYGTENDPDAEIHAGFLACEEDFTDWDGCTPLGGVASTHTSDIWRDTSITSHTVNNDNYVYLIDSGFSWAWDYDGEVWSVEVGYH